MYCKNCGSEVKKNAFACMKCGCDPKKGNNNCSSCGEVIIDINQNKCSKCNYSINDMPVVKSKKSQVSIDAIIQLLLFSLFIFCLLYAIYDLLF